MSAYECRRVPAPEAAAPEDMETEQLPETPRQESTLLHPVPTPPSSNSSPNPMPKPLQLCGLRNQFGAYILIQTVPKNAPICWAHFLPRLVYF